MYRPSVMPWRGVAIPWDDIRLITFHSWGSTSGRGASPHMSFAIFAKQPGRYASSKFRRLVVWWNPALSGATVVISAAFLISHRLKDRQKFVNTVKSTFAAEVGRYNIPVKLNMN